MPSNASTANLLSEKSTDEDDSRYNSVESESSITRYKVPKTAFASRFVLWCWIIYSCTVTFLWIVTITFWLNSSYDNVSLGSYEKGFNTDIVAMVQDIEMVEVRFTGGLEFDNNEQPYRVTSDNPTKYVGDPSPEIDANWDRLESSLEILLTREEAMTISHGAIRTMKEPDADLYRLSADVSHSIHCVNVIRKAIYPDHYYPGKRPKHWATHVEHCVDHVRQAIQCHADLTPLGYRFNTTFKGHGFTFPNWNAVHTCRNYDKILDFMLGRAAPEEIHGTGDDNGYPEDCTSQSTDACKPPGGP